MKPRSSMWSLQKVQRYARVHVELPHIMWRSPNPYTQIRFNPQTKGTSPDVPVTKLFWQRLLGKDRALDKRFDCGLENFKRAFSHPVLRIQCGIYFGDFPRAYLWTFASSTLRILASSTVKPFGTGVPVPLEILESRLSTSKEM